MHRRSTTAALAAALLFAPVLARAEIWWGCAVQVPVSQTVGMRMTIVGPALRHESLSNIYIASFQTPDDAVGAAETYAAQFEAFVASSGYSTVSGVAGADVVSTCSPYASAQAVAEFKAALAADEISGGGSVKTSSNNYELAWAPAAAAPVAAAAPGAPPRFGVQMMAVSAENALLLGLDPPAGAVVVNVVPGSPAAKGGVKPMDVIIEVSGQAVAIPHEVTQIVGRLRDGFQAPVRVWRERAVKDLTVQIGSAEPPPVAAQPAP
jgi:hypothetical protein